MLPIKIQSGQKGISLLFVILIMGIILTVGLGVSGILIKQMGLVESAGKSIVSFYAADSGIEQELYELYKEPLGAPRPGFNDVSMENGAVYTVEAKCGFSALAEDCPVDFVKASSAEECNTINYCLKSVGRFEGTKRAIKINY